MPRMTSRKTGVVFMSVPEVNEDIAVSKALYKKTSRGGICQACKKKSIPLQVKQLADESVKGPPARLSDLVSLRSKHSNGSLRNLLYQADALLAKQDSLIKDVNKLLGMEKAVGVYKKASEDS